MEWSSYMVRRRMDPTEWLRFRKIETKENFYKVLSEMALDPPSPEVVAGMFPEGIATVQKTPSPEEALEAQVSVAKKNYVKNKKMST